MGVVELIIIFYLDRKYYIKYLIYNNIYILNIYQINNYVILIGYFLKFEIIIILYIINKKKKNIYIYI